MMVTPPPVDMEMEMEMNHFQEYQVATLHPLETPLEYQNYYYGYPYLCYSPPPAPTLEDTLHSNIYVRGLDENTSDQDLEKLCQKYGVIISAKAIVDPGTRLCKGFGFVMFAQGFEAESAIKGLEKSGYNVAMARVGPRSVTDSMAERISTLTDAATTNVYISNLPYEMTEYELFGLFEGYTIESCKILYEHGQSRGVGFVRVDTRESAESLIHQFNGFAVDGSEHRLQVRFADSPAIKKIKTQVTKKKRGFYSLSPIQYPTVYTAPQSPLGSPVYSPGFPPTFYMAPTMVLPPAIQSDSESL